MDIYQKIRKVLMVSAIILSILEVLFFFSEDIVVLSVMMPASIIFFNAVFVKRDIFMRYPLSALAILFYTICLVVLPFFATIIEFKPVSFNIRTPIWTYFNVVGFMFLIVFIHGVYRSLFNHRKNLFRKAFAKFGGFKKLSNRQFQILVLISLSYYVISIIVYGGYSDEGEAADMPSWFYVIGLFVRSFLPTAALLVFPKMGLVKNPYLQPKLLIIIVVISSSIGVLTNMRTAVLLVPTTILFCFFLYLLYFDYHFNEKAKRRLIIVVMIAAVVVPLFARVSNVMIMVRQNRSGLSGMEMLSLISNVIDDSRVISDFVLENKSTEEYTKSDDWSEKYLNNDALQRFCCIKFLDETLFHAEKIGYANTEMRNDLATYFLSIFPEALTVPSVYKNHAERREAQIHMSLTDSMCQLSTGDGFGTAYIGSYQGIGLGLFGYTYILVLIPLFIVFFYIFDGLVYIGKNGNISFSYFAIANISAIILFFQPHHVYTYEINQLTRTFWENLFFYLLTMFFIRKLKI